MNLPQHAQIGDLYQPALACKNEAEAGRYFDALVARRLVTSPGMGFQAAVELERSNIAYFAGYGTAEDRERVERLFQAVHPVFGSVRDNGHPTPEQAFAAGILAGARLVL